MRLYKGWQQAYAVKIRGRRWDGPSFDRFSSLSMKNANYERVVYRKPYELEARYLKKNPPI